MASMAIVPAWPVKGTNGSREPSHFSRHFRVSLAKGTGVAPWARGPSLESLVLGAGPTAQAEPSLLSTSLHVRVISVLNLIVFEGPRN